MMGTAVGRPKPIETPSLEDMRTARRGGSPVAALIYLMRVHAVGGVGAELSPAGCGSGELGGVAVV